MVSRLSSPWRLYVHTFLHWPARTWYSGRQRCKPHIDPTECVKRGLSAQLTYVQCLEFLWRLGLKHLRVHHAFPVNLTCIGSSPMAVPSV